MKKQSSRRDFMKSMLAVPMAASVPFVASGMAPLISAPASVSKKYGHKFKISLNVYHTERNLVAQRDQAGRLLGRHDPGQARGFEHAALLD